MEDVKKVGQDGRCNEGRSGMENVQNVGQDGIWVKISSGNRQDVIFVIAHFYSSHEVHCTM
jgi:glycine cleavage system regulatory protein